ncbi:hypothetical protein DL93DRAFT_2035351, partial [Clavulina sp. PMI_390]
LTETELLTICHANLDHPAREAGLTLRSLSIPDGGPSPARTAEQKKLARASTISVMSGLGIMPPEGAPPPDNPGPPIQSPNKIFKLFHRPGNDVIASHLPSFFPNTEKKVLAKTARNSV